MATNRRAPKFAVQPPNDAKPGLAADADMWASGILVVGAPALKYLSYVEHLDFLLSIREEKFKMIFEIWETFGWWILAGCGLVWGINRLSKRNQPHAKGPTWGLVSVCCLMTFLIGAFLAVQSAGGVPNVIIAYSTGVQTQFSQTGAPVEAKIIDPCRVTVDATKLMPFKKDFKLAIACASTDPTKDILSDTQIWVSNLFEINSGAVEIVAASSPSGDFTKPTQQIQRFAILVPRDVGWSKLTTLADLMRIGGKILDARYYNK